MLEKVKTTRQVLLSSHLAKRLQLAAVKSNKCMRELLDELVENAYPEDDSPREDVPLNDVKISIPQPNDAPSEIGSVSLRISPVEESIPDDREGREF